MVNRFYQKMSILHETNKLEKNQMHFINTICWILYGLSTNYNGSYEMSACVLNWSILWIWITLLKIDWKSKFLTLDQNDDEQWLRRKPSKNNIINSIAPNLWRSYATILITWKFPFTPICFSMFAIIWFWSSLQSRQPN